MTKTEKSSVASVMPTVSPRHHQAVRQWRQKTPIIIDVNIWMSSRTTNLPAEVGVSNSGVASKRMPTTK